MLVWVGHLFGTRACEIVLKRDVHVVFKFVFVFVFVLRRDMHVVFKCNVGEVNHRVPSMD